MSNKILYDLCCQVLPPSVGEEFLAEVGERFGESWGNTDNVVELTEIVQRHVEIFINRVEFDDAEALATGQKSAYAERLGLIQTPCDTLLEIAKQFEEASGLYSDADLTNSASRISTFIIVREIIYATLGFDSLSEDEANKEAEVAELVAKSLQAFALKCPVLARKASDDASILCDSCMSQEFIQEEIFGILKEDEND